jgi:hypothetical protein
MNSRRAHAARIGIVALAAVAFLLAFAIPRSNRTAGVPAGARSVGLQADIAGLPILSGQVRPAANSRFLTPKSPIQNPKLVESYGRLPLTFEANRGQTDGQVKFLSRGRGYTMFLTQGEAVLSLRKPSGVSNQLSALGKGMALAMPSAGPRSSRALAPEGLLARPTDTFASLRSSIDNSRIPNPETRSPAVLRMTLVGSNPKAKVTGLDELPGKSNYFIGNDPKKWRTNVPQYAKVKYKDVYPGIDLVYYGNQRQLEYDFVVSPGADPRVIALSIDGADKMEIDAQGDLVLRAEAGDVRLHKPLVYQPSPSPGSFNPKSKITNPKFLDARFVLRSSSIDNRQSSINNSRFEIAFEIASHDPRLPLVIDPVLSYSTYLGGSGGDAANAVAVDADGNAYVTGNTSSIDFPTQNALQPGSAGPLDIFVAKLTPGGSSLAYSTYFGGRATDLPREIAVDSYGNAYVMGVTRSGDFPTLNAFQTGRNGMCDAFVFKLDPTGSALLYSTYLGGSGVEDPSDPRTGGIAVDSAGNAYVTGTTDTSDFPTKNAMQPAYAEGICGTPPDQTFPCPDAFVAKFNTNLSGQESLVYSTYLGGSGSDKGFDIAVDPVGNVYVTGWATSANFPTTPGAVQQTYRGVQNAFVTKLSPDGSLVYSTYLGGSMGDRGEGIAVDTEGNAYVTGSAVSTDFPTTAGAFQVTAHGGDCIWYPCDDAFVSKLNPAGSALVYSTYLGSSGGDKGAAIAVDSQGNAYVTGPTNMANDFPMVNPIQPTYVGGPCVWDDGTAYPCFDAFVCKLGPSGTLVFSTYLGATGDEGGNGIAVDPSGNIYVAGGTSSADFPITPGAFQTSLRGGNDAFVVKIGPADNTPAGTGVNVTLTKAVSLTFDSVATSGTTGVTRTNTGPEPPAGFSLGHPPTYYELSTTAVFSGSVEVCINYTGTNYGNESKLKLFHLEEGKWVDRTVSRDTTNDIICASVTSLSPFAVLEDRRIEAEGLKPPLADLTLEGLPVAMPGNAFKQARTLPLRLGLLRDGVALGNADVSPPQIVALIRNGAPLDLATMDLDAGQANDNGVLFRFSDGNWVYNLSTQGLSPGTYTITMQMPDGRRWNAGFVLR